jgi:hypothetical protein
VSSLGGVGDKLKSNSSNSNSPKTPLLSAVLGLRQQTK